MISLTTLCFTALALADRVSADGWDDFANNMATDLAPIISLFGEQITKQYLSESIYKIDYFIFAMAPIGILTALVSAIRVCGSPSLKAFIGRAKEGAGPVEAELLSSTSDDVCELYNSGGGITRIFGRPKILEVVLDSSAPDDDFTNPEGHSGIFTFQDYIKTERGKMEWRYHEDKPREGEFRVKGWKCPPQGHAPNLSHNVGIKRLGHWWFLLAATTGFVLQGGVLAFAVIATYHLKWEKDGSQPPAYACPMAVAGTVLVCGGVYLCAYLVGESTIEKIYSRTTPDSKRSSIYWLQPAQVVGDQTFESFCFVDSSGPDSLDQYIFSWKDYYKPPALFVWVAVCVSVVGFVFQFVGFRGIHSAISMAQLGAALLMSITRTALRMHRLDGEDGGSNPFGRRSKLLQGSELDWLVFRMAKVELQACLGEVYHRFREPFNDAFKYLWTFLGTLSSDITVNDEETQTSEDENLHCVHKILAYRSALAKLTDSTYSRSKDGQTLSRHFPPNMVRVRQTARKLLLAIESVVNTVFRLTPRMKDGWWEATTLRWIFDCGVSTNDWFDSSDYGLRRLSKVPVTLTRNANTTGEGRGSWKVKNEADIEAILGLWVFSLVSDRKTGLGPDNNVIDVRRLVFLGQNPEEPNFRFWVRGRLPPEFKEFDIQGADEDWTPSTIWSTPKARRGDENGPLLFLSAGKSWERSDASEQQHLFGWYTGEPSSSLASPGKISPVRRHAWAIDAVYDLVSLCAQEMLGVFVKSILEAILDIGYVSVDESSETLRLRSQLVSELVNGIAETELASRDDALLCVLPQVVSKEHHARRTPLWYAAGLGHEMMVKNLLEETDIDKDARDEVEGRTPLWVAAANGHDRVIKLLLNAGADPCAEDKTGLTPLCKAAAEGHEAVVRLLLDETDADPDLRGPCGKTALWLAASGGHESVVRALLEGADLAIPDDEGVTPMVEAVRKGHEIVTKLLLLGRDAGAETRTDIGGTSLIEDESKREFADRYESLYQKSFLDSRLPLDPRSTAAWRDRIRIAIIGTGVNFKDVDLQIFLDAWDIKTKEINGRSWTGKPSSWTKDEHGYGTEATSVVLRFAPAAQIFVAKVAQDGQLPVDRLHLVAESIEYAVNEWDVDIVYFGMVIPEVHRKIKASIDVARRKGKIVMAAAGAIGFDARRSYPASSPHVIAIHAVDGRGRDCDISSAPIQGEYNFSALGVALYVRSQDKEKQARCVVSGAPYAAGVATGMAASFLEFARFRLQLEDPEDRKWICSADGMRQMFRLMSTKIDGYNCLAPWELFAKGSTDEEICGIIMMAVRKRRLGGRQ